MGQAGACLLSLAQQTVLYGWLFDEISGKNKQCCDKKKLEMCLDEH